MFGKFRKGCFVKLQRVSVGAIFSDALFICLLLRLISVGVGTMVHRFPRIPTRTTYDVGHGSCLCWPVFVRALWPLLWYESMCACSIYVGLEEVSMQ